MKSQIGQNLIELLVALAVATCVLSAGIPQLLLLRDSMTQRSAANALLGALHFARNQAVTDRATTSLCHGLGNCSSSKTWQSALVVFTDLNGNGVIDGGDRLLRSIPIEQGYTWRWSSFRSSTRISYAADGTTLALNGTFTLCQGNTPRRQIVISLSGRPRVREPATSAKCS